MPRSLDEAAYVDVCDKITVLRRIVLPIAATGRVAMAIIFIFGFQRLIVRGLIAGSVKE